MVLGLLGCLLSMLGLIWGIFFKGFVWIAFIGILLMAITLIFYEEE